MILNNNMMKTIGERLTYIFEKKGFNANSIGKETNTHPSTIKNYLTDNSRPNYTKLEVISKKIGVSVDWLLTGIGECSNIFDDKTEENDSNHLIREIEILKRTTDMQSDIIDGLKFKINIMQDEKTAFETRIENLKQELQATRKEVERLQLKKNINRLQLADN